MSLKILYKNKKILSIDVLSLVSKYIVFTLHISLSRYSSVLALIENYKVPVSAMYKVIVFKKLGVLAKL